MPLYMIERNFPEPLAAGTEEEILALQSTNQKYDLHWVYSFLSDDAKRSYCIYQGPNVEAIVEAAQVLGLPADTITQIDGRINSDGQVVLLSLADFERERANRLRMEQELDSARNLQLGMLPDRPPALENAEIGLFTRPATEVGGDYYDYILSDDSTLTLTLGDATGHGMEAGTIVAGTKGLFQILAQNADLVETLTQMSGQLRKMRIGRNGMALAMIKLQENRLSYSSAGIPPMLIHRNRTNEVQEILSGGLPLGLRTVGKYCLHDVELLSGDTILLMTDGLPERLNHDGEQFGYARTTSTFGEIAHNGADRICELLALAGDEWANGREQEDDVSFAVLKYRSKK